MTVCTYRRAFTLIELLVVIAIIAILAAILFPVFAQAKAAAKASVCLSNMKQVGTGFGLYLNDSDDTLPLSGETRGYDMGSWVANGSLPSMPACSNKFYDLDLCTVADPTRGGLWPYEKNKEIYRCPMDQTGKYKFTGAAVSSAKQWVTYGMNYYVSGYPESYVSFPAGTVLIVDEDVTTRNNGSFLPCYSPNGDWSCDSLADEFGLQHAQGANMLFNDFHVKRRNRKEFNDRSPAHKIWFPNRPNE